MLDCIIIGQGPAGISAALYVCRAGYSVTIIKHGKSALEKAHKIENYYGLLNPISGLELLEIGMRQAEILGARFIDAEVTGIEGSGPFELQTTKGLFCAKTVILATGKSRNKPKLEGLAKFEGKGVSYCAVCDGFFYRGKKVGVLGAGAYAASEASYLAAFCLVTIFTNGEPIAAELPAGVRVDTRPVLGLIGDDRLEGILLDHEKIVQEIDGLFIAIGSATALDFAAKLGIFTDGNAIRVDENQMTNIQGLFAAGDCTGRLSQISTAVGQGAVAGTQAVKYLKVL